MQGTCTVEVALDGAVSKDSWLFKKAWSEHGSFHSSDELQSLPDSDASSTTRFRRRIEDLKDENARLMHFNSFQRQFNEIAGAAVAKLGSFFKNRVSVLAWWQMRGSIAGVCPLLTATKMLGGDFSQALLTLSMSPSPSCGGPEASFSYRFYMPGGEKNLFTTQLMYRTQFHLAAMAAQSRSIERPIAEWSNDWSRAPIAASSARA